MSIAQYEKYGMEKISESLGCYGILLYLERLICVFQVLRTCKNAFYHDDSGKVVFLAFAM